MNTAQSTSIISVYGHGEISAKPDTVRLSITTERTAKTVQEAQLQVNELVKKVLLMLTVNKIKDEWIQTADLYFHPSYLFKDNSHVLIGQEVEQNIICTIPNVSENIDNIRFLLDNITGITDSIRVKLHFGFLDSEGKKNEARQYAYRNAYEKAKLYAESAGLTIIKTLKISEFQPSDTDIDNSSGRLTICGNIPDTVDSPSTHLPIGNIQIAAKLYCDFLAE
jgi:uncharacterized protein YggE